MRTAAGRVARPATTDRLALVGICLGFLLVLFDATAVNVAVESVRRSIGGSATTIPWVLNAYTVAFAALMLAAGSLGDRWGSRRCFLGGLGVFAVASAACAAAPSVGLLIAARAVQGAGAAAIVPCSLALIAHRFPPGPARGRALAAWGGISGIGLAAGPVAGGLVVAWAGWRAVFLVVVPLSLAGMALVARTLQETPRREQARFDVAGQAVGASALLCVTAALGLAATGGWVAVAPLALFVVGLVSAVAFVGVERRSAHPVLPLGVFSRPASGVAVAIGALFNFALYGTIYCLASSLQAGRDLSPQAAGLALLPLTATVAIGALLSGRVGSPRGAMTLGLAGGALGAVLLAVVDRAGSAIALAAGGALLGSCGLAMPAMTGLALAGAPSGRLALGAGILNTSRQVGGALGVALTGGIVTASATASLRVAMLIVAGAYVVAVLLARAVPPAREPATAAAGGGARASSCARRTPTGRRPSRPAAW